MGRKNNNAQRHFDTRMTFKELCRLIDVSPYQRTMIMRFLKLGGGEFDMSVTIEMKGGSVASVTDDTGAAVDFTVTDASATPAEVVAKAAVDAVAGVNATEPTVDTGAVKAAADAVAQAAAEEAAKF